jgi:hypothetical protein
MFEEPILDLDVEILAGECADALEEPAGGAHDKGRTTGR